MLRELGIGVGAGAALEGVPAEVGRFLSEDDVVDDMLRAVAAVVYRSSGGDSLPRRRGYQSGRTRFCHSQVAVESP